MSTGQATLVLDDLLDTPTVSSTHSAQSSNDSIDSSTLTCLTCRQTFETPDDQKAHFQNQWHRFNLKRRVANLPPIDEATWSEKVAIDAEKSKVVQQDECLACRKKFNSRKAHDHHMRSKKHLESQRRYEERASRRTEGGSSSANGPLSREDRASEREQRRKERAAQRSEEDRKSDENSPHGEAFLRTVRHAHGVYDSDSESEDDDEEIDDEDRRVEESNRAQLETALRAVRSLVNTAEVLEPEDCIFCGKMHDSLAENVEHMCNEHSFFIPEAEFVSDLRGLIRYLAEKVSVGRLCLYCNGRGRSFKSLSSVQQHMRGQSHCKLLYTDEDMFEYSPYYDFTSSYPEGLDPASGVNVESPVSVAEDGMSLVIGDKLVYHRSVARQMQREDRRAKNSKRDEVDRVVAHYQRLAWANQGKQQYGLATARRWDGDKKALLTRAEIKKIPAYRLQERYTSEGVARRNSWQTKLGIKANKLQHHFRDQVLF